MVKTKVLLFLFWAAALCAQTPNFQNLTIEDGLSQGMIFDICQTRDGFLWIATKDGLNRYDGYNFKVYSNDPFNPYAIAENMVTVLFEDSRGWLWVGLDTKGVDLYDPKTGRFHHFPLDFGASDIFRGNALLRILETSDNAIWIAKHGGELLRIGIPAQWKTAGIPAHPDLQALAQVKNVPLPFPGERVEQINLALRASGELLLTTFRGQYLIHPETHAWRPAHENLVAPLLLAAAAGNEAAGGDTWLLQRDEADGSRKLCRIRNGQAVFFQIPESGWSWLRLMPGRSGNVWLTIDTKIWELSPGEAPDFSAPDLLLDASPTCITYDRTGTLWMGTNGYGLRKLNPTQALFHAGAVGMSIRGVWASGERYLVRDQLFNIKNYDPKTGNVSTQATFLDTPYRIANLAFGPSGDLWMLCLLEGAGNGTLRHYLPGSLVADAEYELDARPNVFDPLLYTPDGRLWMAVNQCRLVSFDARSKQFTYYELAHLFGEKANAVKALSLTQDGNGTLWVGTQSGLVKCLPKPGAERTAFDFQLYQANVDNPKGLNNNVINHLLPDPAEPGKTLWIATKGGGINRMDIASGECQHLTTDDGLLNNVVYGILPAGQHKSVTELWCSTNRGLAKLVEHPGGKLEITTFTAALGLQDNEFNTYAFCKTDRGELLFGGVNGLNRFFPEQLKKNAAPPPVFIVGLEINHQKADLGSPNNPLGRPLEALRELRLHYGQNNLSFEFSALDFTDPSKNRYRYRLVGLDGDWVETGNLRFAHFNHLSPGRYEFRVQGSNGESGWVDAANSFTVIILPPWWRSKLAYLCYFLLLAWAGWRAWRFQIGWVKEQEQLAFEHRETERLKMLEQMKTNFFSNVTHEFRTPLTLIIEPLRQLMKNPGDPDRGEKIRLAERNSRRLLTLVNQLLDMAKIESGSMGLDLRRGDFGQTVRDVFETFLPLAAKKNIKLTLAGERHIPAFEFDPNKVELVLNNLISNALKFTPEGGQVQVRLNPSSAAAELTLSVTDTGIGIPAEALGKVFERFYQVENAGSAVSASSANSTGGGGTGIGLALSKELVELMGGGISVKSEVGKGSTFTFWVPMQAGVSAPVPVQVPAAAPEFFARETPARQPFGEAERPVVLVVEDNAELRTFIKKSIGENWQVVEASNGDEGVKKAIELLPDLVVSDVMMPVKSGYELCDELKTNELTAHVPIILLTAKSAIESKLKGFHTGADDYLTKPFNTEELLARMENLVELRRKLRKRYGSKPLAEVMRPSEAKSDPDREFLKKFTLLLDAHLSDETMGVEEFSQKMFLSRSQLYRKLKAVTDRSASDFIRDYRLERAFAMLNNREGRVGEVALRVGFGNEKHFSTVFKEKFGVPPSQV